MRLCFGAYWLYNFLWSLWHFQHANLPVGIAKFLDLNFLSIPGVKWLLSMLAFAGLAMYLKGRFYSLSLSILFLLSLLVFSAEESSGVYYRVSLLTMVWLAQLLAVWLHSEQTLRDKSIYFSVQIISAAYILAAYSKLSFSGLGWISDAKYFELQVLKGDYFNWATNMGAANLQAAAYKVKFVRAHLTIIQCLLALSLMLETLALFILRSKKVAFYYGLTLFSMHLGIYLMMDIFIAPVAVPMFIFLVNPIYNAATYFQTKAKQQSLD